MESLVKLENDALGIGTSAGKLFDAIERIFGSSESTKIKKQSKALEQSFDENPMATFACLASEKGLSAEKLDILMRANERRIITEIKEQENIEQTIEHAIEYTEKHPEDENSSEEKASDDWLMRYFDYAKQICDENMQGLWGKILSQEANKPNSYSLRTLEVLKNLTRDEAELFRKLSSYVSIEKGFILKPNNYNEKGLSTKLSYENIVKLQDCGVLHITQKLSISAVPEMQELDLELDFVYIHGVLQLKKKDDCIHNNLSIPVLKLTEAGFQMLNLIEGSEPWEDDYLEYIKKNYKDFDITYTKHENI